MATTIQYNLEVKNNSKQTFKEVQADAKKTDDGITKIVESGKKVGNAFKDTGKGMFKGITDGVKEAGNAFVNLPKTIIKAFSSLAINAIKTAAIVFVITKALNGLTAVGDKFGKTSFFGKMATDLHAVISRLIPFKRQLSNAVQAAGNSFRGIGIAFNFGYDGIVGFADVLKRVNMKTDKYRDLYESIFKLGKAFGATKQMAYNVSGAMPGISKAFKSLKDVTDRLTASWNKYAKLGEYISKQMPQLARGAMFVVNNIGAIVKVALAAAIALVVFKKAFAISNEIATLGDAIDENAKRIGFSAEAYQTWDHILQHSGTSASEMEQGISSLAKKLNDANTGVKGAKEAFQQLRVSITDSSGALRSQEDIFTEVMGKLADMQDVTKRNALLTDIFGKSGKNLIPVLDDNSKALKRNYEESKRLMIMNQRTIDASIRFKDAQKDLEDSFKASKANIWASVIERIGDSFLLIKNSKIGTVLTGFGAGIAFVVGRLVDLINILSSIGTTLLGLVDVITGGFTLAITTLKAELFGLFSKIPLLNKFFDEDTLATAKREVEAMTELLNESGLALKENFKDIGRAFASFFGKRPPTPAKTPSNPFVPDAIDPTGKDKTKELLDARKALYESFYGWLRQAEYDAIVNPQMRALTDVTNEFIVRKKQIDDAFAKGVVSRAAAQNMVNQLAAVARDAQKRIAVEFSKTLPTRTTSITTETIIKDETTNKLAEIRDKNKENMDSLQILRDKDLISEQEYYNKRKALAIQYGYDRGVIEKEGADALLALRATDAQSTRETITQWVDITKQAFDLVAGLASTYYDGKAESENRLYDREKTAIENSSNFQIIKQRQLQALEAKHQEELKKQFKAKQSWARAEAAMNWAVALTEIWMKYGTSLFSVPIAIAQSALVSGQMAAQLAVINSQAFAKGGVVQGSGGTDSQLVRATPGEMILTSQQQANLLSMANRGSSGQTIDASITITGNADSSTVDQIRALQSDQLIKLRKQLEELDNHNELSFLRYRTA
jgi:hypothetical protein